MTENPIPLVVCAVFHHGRVLLLQRRFAPGAGRWALPAGFVEPGETAAESVAREVSEETGLAVSPCYLGSRGRVDPDGRAFLSLDFVAHVARGDVRLDHESTSWRWVGVEPALLAGVAWAIAAHRDIALRAWQQCMGCASASTCSRRAP